MSSNERAVQVERNRGAPSATVRALGALLLAVAAETGLTIAHFVYGAHLYQEPAREHVVLPALAFLVVALALGGRYAWKRSHLVLALLSAQVAVCYLALFGGYHGAFGHGLKDLLFFMGVSPERLQEIFDSPDFVVPDSVLFEVSGLATFGAAAVVAYFLIRLIRLERSKRRPAASCA